ncbi:ankyrin repeat-containing domain protein [Russula earlei]|uniref:Ankyrin repeat-containing domain protein n=1 Tax=Russula earlei TaxID=71964 RepID=A0ACC0UJ59_9AGAM|nr:ankyrin repeat-containing domain protein [Russula earlei]
MEDRRQQRCYWSMKQTRITGAMLAGLRCTLHQKTGMTAALSVGRRKCDLEHQVNVNARDLWGRTALHEWTGDGCMELVRAVLDLEADANARGGGTRWTDSQMWTPLHEASQLEHLEIIHLLLDRGVDVNAQRMAGRCPMDGKEGMASHDAAQSGRLEVARLLLNRGADVKAWVRTLSMALHLAAEGGHRQVVQLSLEKVESHRRATKRARCPSRRR